MTAKQKLAKGWYAKNKQLTKDRAALWAKNNPEARRAVLQRFSLNHAEELREYGASYRKNNQPKEKQRHKIYRGNNKEKIHTTDALYRKVNSTKLKEKNRMYKKNFPEKSRRNCHLYHAKLRVEAIAAYGGVCKCCPEDRPDRAVLEFLSIDHMNNDGAAHRRLIGSGNIYRWLKKNNYPSGFQVLCHGCNLAKAFYGICPHQKTKLSFHLLVPSNIQSM
jgi:hypothetical protein